MALSAIVSGLATVAPEIAGWLGGSDAEETAEQVAGVAKSVTGHSDAQSAVEAIKQDPEQARKFKEALQEYRIKMERERTEQMGKVNNTMQAESESEHWPQYSWRPFNGFLFGITMFGVYFLLPLLDKDVPEIPYWVWMAWASVLGVTAWHRGKQKRIKAGDTQGALSKAAGAVKQVVGKSG